MMGDRFKFRIWDNDNDVFDYIDLAGDTQDLIEKLHVYSNYFSDIWIKENPALLQQCTGVKDKNGTFIYEGDIVTQQHLKTNYVVKFCNYGECCGFLLEDAIKHSNCTGKSSSLLNPRYLEKYYIIGNIYENKELLEEKIHE